jgi:flagellar biosynthesis protein
VRQSKTKNEEWRMKTEYEKNKKAAALKYEHGKQAAPQLLAKGDGVLAEKILEVAKEHSIPIHEDPALVEILSKMDLLEQIPPECYRVVAEILAFIYKTHHASTLPAAKAEAGLPPAGTTTPHSTNDLPAQSTS